MAGVGYLFLQQIGEALRLIYHEYPFMVAIIAVMAGYQFLEMIYNILTAMAVYGM